MRLGLAYLLLLVFVFAGCAITQEVKPVALAQLPTKEVCIRENRDVRPGFLDAYKKALTDKGLSVRVIDPEAGVTACPLLTTYVANWRWDFTMYMAYAQMVVYRDGVEVGKAVYDAAGGGGRFDKWINADEKVRELVNQLFPG